MGGNQGNEELRRILQEIGWSPYELARQVNRTLPEERRVHLSTPFAWRDRGTVPRSPLPSVIAGVLTAAYGQVVTVDRLWPGRATPTAVWQPTVADLAADRWTAEATVILLARSSHIATGEGPTYFPVSGTELCAFARAWAFGNHPMLSTAVSAGTTALTTEFVDYLEHDLANLRRLDDGHSGRLLLRTVDMRLSQVIEIIRDCTFPTPLARRLFSVAGQMAQMAGWIAFDHDLQGLAQRMYLIGLRAAAAAGDRSLGALILSCIAVQQNWRGHNEDAAAIMTTVDRGLRRTLPPQARALIALRQARAFAGVSMPVQTSAALDQAFAALDSRSGEPEPGWSYWIDIAVLTGEAGRCHLALGDARRAETDLTNALSGISTESTRDRILYGLSLALTHAPGRRRIGDVEMSCYQVDLVLPLIPKVGSARCRSLLDTVLAELRPYRTTAAVRDLFDKAESLRQPLIC